MFGSSFLDKFSLKSASSSEYCIAVSECNDTVDQQGHLRKQGWRARQKAQPAARLQSLVLREFGSDLSVGMNFLVIK